MNLHTRNCGLIEQRKEKKNDSHKYQTQPHASEQSNSEATDVTKNYNERTY